MPESFLSFNNSSVSEMELSLKRDSIVATLATLVGRGGGLN